MKIKIQIKYKNKHIIIVVGSCIVVQSTWTLSSQTAAVAARQKEWPQIWKEMFKEILKEIRMAANLKRNGKRNTQKTNTHRNPVAVFATGSRQTIVLS